MDRATIEQLLHEAESRLHHGERNIAHQRELIATLERRGQDAADAKSLLRRLEIRQARHIADRNRLFLELASASVEQ
jgi:hypothetical protein